MFITQFLIFILCSLHTCKNDIKIGLVSDHVSLQEKCTLQFSMIKIRSPLTCLFQDVKQVSSTQYQSGPIRPLLDWTASIIGAQRPIFFCTIACFTCQICSKTYRLKNIPKNKSTSLIQASDMHLKVRDIIFIIRAEGNQHHRNIMPI